MRHVQAHHYFTLEALIIIYVHMRDVLHELIKNKVRNIDDFDWKKCVGEKICFALTDRPTIYAFHPCALLLLSFRVFHEYSLFVTERHVFT